MSEAVFWGHLLDNQYMLTSQVYVRQILLFLHLLPELKFTF
jgi:hypothetical protein